MTESVPTGEHDSGLRRRIATLMRWGTAAASVFFIAGALLGWAGAAVASTAGVVAGCGVLILLPFVRLLLMLGAFARRRDGLYVGITTLVITLVVTSAATGLLR